MKKLLFTMFYATVVLAGMGLLINGSETYAYCPIEDPNDPSSYNCHSAECESPTAPITYPLEGPQVLGIGMCTYPDDFIQGENGYIDGGTYYWQCRSDNSPNNTLGYPQHTTVDNCSVAAKYNGACGTANGGTYTTMPTTGLCQAGTPFMTVTTTGGFTWSCLGENGGATANCSASLPATPSISCVDYNAAIHTNFNPQDISLGSGLSIGLSVPNISVPTLDIESTTLQTNSNAYTLSGVINSGSYLKVTFTNITPLLGDRTQTLRAPQFIQYKNDKTNKFRGCNTSDWNESNPRAIGNAFTMNCQVCTVSTGSTTYSWDVSAWSVCSNNQQTRSVVCRDNNGNVVSDNLCTQPKPNTTQTASCPSTGPVCGMPSTQLVHPVCYNGNFADTIPTNGSSTPGVYNWTTGECGGDIYSCQITQNPDGTRTANITYQHIAELINGACSFLPDPNPPYTRTETSTNQMYGSCNVGTIANWDDNTETWQCIEGNNTVNCGINVCIDPTLGGCFIADTLVTLADGSKKPIQDIVVGDTLKAVHGTNTVVSLLRPLLGHQDIYAINSQDAFFTANHPFLTTDGWKSLDPETTKKEIPDLEVTMLTIGDTLITEGGNIVILSIEHTTSDASTQLYNFELSGDHTYYANGYAVHNKRVPNNGCDLNTGVGCTPSPNKVGQSCTYNSDCYGARLYCDNTTKTCQYSANVTTNTLNFDDPICSSQP